MEKVPAPAAPSFIAVNRTTGKLVWADNSPGGKILEGQWSSPAYHTVDGRPQIVFAGGDGWLYAFEPETGKRLWKFDCKTDKPDADSSDIPNHIVATPTCHGGKVFVAVGQNPENGAGPGCLWAVDASKVADITRTGKVWQYGGKDFGRSLSTAAIRDGLLYAAELNGYVHCLDAGTGKRLWRHDLGAPVWASPLVADGRIRWKYKAVGKIRSSPCVHGGAVFFGDDDGVLHAVEARTGTARWTFKAGSEIISSANVEDGRVLFGSYDDYVYCLAEKDGAVVWKRETEDKIHGPPAVVGDRMLVAGCDARLRAIRIADGTPAGTVNMPSYSGASVAVERPRLYVGTMGNEIVVGDAVRGSLRDLAADRLGRVDQALVSGRFFRDAPASEIAGDGEFRSRFSQACPAILVRGAMRHAESGAAANRIQVLGVDDRFWQLDPNHVATGEVPLAGRSIVLNRPLARELGAKLGDDVLVQVERQSDVPRELLFGRPDRARLSLRLTVRGIIPAKGLGGFALNPTQAQPGNAFVPLATLQRAMKRRGRCNVILVAARPDADASRSADTDRLQRILDEHVTLDDVGLKLRYDDAAHCAVLESTRFLLAPAVESAALAAAQSLRAPCTPVLTNTISVGPAKQATSPSGAPSPVTAVAPVHPLRAGPSPGRFPTARGLTSATSTPSANRCEIPYATVAALVWPTSASATRSSNRPVPTLGRDDILLNDWAADDLGARPGARIDLAYFAQGPFGQLRTERTTLRLRGIVRMHGLTASQSLVPECEGVTDAKHITDWDPPFPIDLNRIREKDERYWDDDGPTPKAFVSLATGQRLWARQHDRFGRLTSIRIGLADGKDLRATADAFEKGPGSKRGTGSELNTRSSPRKSHLTARCLSPF